MSIRASSFFDLDHTLIRINSSFQFGIYLYKNSLITKSMMCKLIGYYSLYKLGRLSPRDIHEIACRQFFIGKSLSEMKRHAENFLDSIFLSSLNPLVVPALNAAKASKHLIGILSSSPSFLVKGFATRLAVTIFSGTEFVVEKDQIVAMGSFMGGEEKKEFFLDFCQKNNVSKSLSTAYTDSHFDLPLLEAVGTAVGVNPSCRLKKICKANGWKILQK